MSSPCTQKSQSYSSRVSRVVMYGAASTTSSTHLMARTWREEEWESHSEGSGGWQEEGLGVCMTACVWVCVRVRVCKTKLLWTLPHHFIALLFVEDRRSFMNRNLLIGVNAYYQLLSQLFRLPQLIRMSVMNHIVTPIAPNTSAFGFTHCFKFSQVLLKSSKVLLTRRKFRFRSKDCKE